jgi:short-subunit dehydrogenase
MNLFITGASSGIGAALARQVAREGHSVGLVARRHDRLAAVLADCPNGRMWVADLVDLERAEQIALEAWDACPIDVLVNNAAMPKRRSVTGLGADEVERVMAVNFFAPVRLTLALLPRMLARGSGTIVNVSSMGGRLGIIHEAAYSASKFALCGWSESMAIDLYGKGVSVKLIQPGPVDTEIWDQPDNEAPLYEGPKVSAEEVADGIVAALSSERFEHYLPDLKAIVDGKQADVDAFIAGSARMAG